MTLKEIVMSAWLAGTAALSGGCLNSEQYHFNGKIGQTEVHFYEHRFTDTNKLDILKSDGTKVEYTDYGGDYHVNSLTITYPSNVTDTYSINGDAVEKTVIAKAQEQFESYLQAILDDKEEYRQQKELYSQQDRQKRITKAIETITK